MQKIAFVILGVIMMSNLHAQKNLVLEWDFFHPVRMEWMPLGEKGSVQEALIETGELPDPFYGTNEQKFGWIEEHVWKFKSIVILNEEDLQYEYLELEFGNIDTYGEVSINGAPLMSTKNAFIPHRKQAKDLLKVGVNEINVEITPPVIYHKDDWENGDFHYPAPNDVHEIAIAPLTRKPQYQFGWDWALRMNTIGFNKPAKIFMYDHNRIVNESVNIISVNDEKKEAKIRFGLQLAVTSEDRMYRWLSGFADNAVKSKDGWVYLEIIQKDIELWWPKGQGAQKLYTDEVMLIDASDSIEMHATFKYGIKTSELIREEDQWGTSYYFKINGRKIFCKGGDYIPQDIFPARVEDKDIEAMVETMAESNFNMVRVWGGGYYPDEIFFETCDRLGVMVWEDLMFACSMYPGDSAFIDNISEEFNYQVPRISKHASVVQFNGNNEVEVAWGNWGFQIKYGLYGQSAKTIEAAYDKVFKETAPTIISKYTNIPYIHTSPLSNWGKAELYNHGSQHYWGVWHGKDPIQDFGKKIGRFNAEYGFQSFPEYSTLLTFSDTSQWQLNSEVMKHHQKSYVGNDMILKHAKRLYGNPADFETFVYYSQLTQAMAVSMAVAGHRIDFPRCGGTLYWQINDCWPAPTWSSLDYFNNWKALQYRIKDDYKEVTVLERFEDLDQTDYILVSGVVDTFVCEFSCRITNEKGKEIERWTEKITVEGMTNVPLLTQEQLKRWSSKNLRIEFVWNDAEGRVHERSFDRFTDKWQTATCDDVDLSYQKSEEKPDEYIVTVSCQKYLRDLWLYCDQPGAKFEQNFQSLLPGDYKFVVSVPNNESEVHFDMRWH